MQYEKGAITIEQQIALLKQRGLIIENDAEAEHFLSHISYYRLAGYWWPFLQDKAAHIFKPGSYFRDVISLYEFDRKLRLLLFKVIERIEISLRSKLIYHLSHEFGPWWFQQTELFINVRELAITLALLDEEINRSKETFIKEHRKRYKDDGRFPPAWKSLELTSFGALSKLYGNLKPSCRSKDRISAEFGTVNHAYLPSWLQSITQIRNHCAHHNRLWNRNLPGRPRLLSNPPFSWVTDMPKENEFEKLYVHLCCMKYLLDRVDASNSFTADLQKILGEHPNVDSNALGLKPDWQDEPLWKA